MRPLPLACDFELPAWLPPFVAGWEGGLDSAEDRMRLAIALSRENVARGSGGPFAALVYDLDRRRLLAAGVNLVTSLNLSAAHAEIIAISLAQSALGDWNLAAAGAVELTSSCEPCAMCYGAIPWSGVRRVVCGAGKEDAERAGFDEGDKPPDWFEALERRGIEVRRGVLREEAAVVFEKYARESGVIYNP